MALLAALAVPGAVDAAPAARQMAAEDAPPVAVAVVNGTGERIVYDVVDGMAIIENDIVLGTHAEVQANGIEPLEVGASQDCPVGHQCGVILTSSQRAWPNSIVPYTLASGTTTAAAETIQDAIDHWEEKTSIRFVPRTNEVDYVEFVGTGNGNICSSRLGRSGGRQVINYAGNGRGCMVHEIGHAVGLSHEQNRNDRDNYINIDFSNISGNAASQFRKATGSTDVGQYDFNSVMHYSAYSFALDRSKPVITAKDGRDPRTIGSRGVLTPSDVAAVEFVYGNNPPPPPPTTTTTTRPTTTTTQPTTTTTEATTTTTEATTTTTEPTTTTTEATTTTTEATTTTTRPTTTTTRPTTTTTRPTTTVTRPTTTVTRPTTTATTAPTTRPTISVTLPSTSTTVQATTTTAKETTTTTRETTTTVAPTTAPPTTTPPTTTPPTTTPPTTTPTTKPPSTTPPTVPDGDRKPVVTFNSVKDGDVIPRKVPYGGINVVAYDPNAGTEDGDGIRWVTLVLHDAETGRFLGARREYWSTYDWGLRLRSGRSYTLTAYAVSKRKHGGGWSKTSITVTAE